MNEQTPERMQELTPEPPQVVRDEWAVLAGARFALALAVVVYHVRTVAPVEGVPAFDGLFPVLGFLVLSGYSIRSSVRRDGDVRRFYARRAWRIAPAYLAGLALAAVPYALYGSRAHDPWPYLPPSTVQAWLAQFVMLQGFLTRPVGAAGVTWSLSVEVALYALAPLLARLRARAVGGIILASALACLSWPLISGGQPPSQAIHGAALLAFAWAWLLGWLASDHRERPWFTGAGVLMMVILSNNAGFTPLGALLSAGPLVLLGAADRCPLSPQGRRLLLWLGDLSYPLYLAHWPVLMLIRIAAGPGAETWAQPRVYVGASLAAAALVLYLVERPAQHLRRMLSRR